MVDMFPLLCFLARTRNLQIAFLSKFQSLAHGVNEVLKYACQVVCTSFRELNFLTNFLQRKAGFRILLFFLSCLRTKNLLKILGCVAGHLRTICLLDDLFCLNPSDNASDGKVFSVPMHYWLSSVLLLLSHLSWLDYFFSFLLSLPHPPPPPPFNRRNNSDHRPSLLSLPCSSISCHGTHQTALPAHPLSFLYQSTNWSIVWFLDMYADLWYVCTLTLRPR